jgi:SAM-dependent methyltransferase
MTQAKVAGLAPALRAALACPACRAGLEETGAGLRCTACGAAYPPAPGGGPDLRLRAPVTRSLEFSLGTPPLREEEMECVPLVTNPAPAVDLAGVRVPRHLTPELMSWFPKPRAPESLALDLGCGDLIHREVVERAGFVYAGIDYVSQRAPILGDAHALPFAGDSIEFILSVAVLEHLRWPFVAMREACRVMRPGGTFIGTVAFLEPFHENSHYHHTHLGTINSLRYGGFEVVKVAPSAEWTVLTAQAGMGLFPRVPAPVAKALVYPLEALQRILWSAGSLLKPDPARRSRTRNTTGAFAFIARKPDVRPG